ncbi:MAG: OmpA family protein [bacterium]
MVRIAVFLAVLLIAASSVRAQTMGCVQAKEIYRQGVRSRDYRQKAELYREALRKCPSYAEAHNNLADALERLGRLEEAEAQYREAARLKPGLAVAHFGRGDVLRKMGRHAEAVAAYQRGLTLRPGDDLARKGIAQARAALPPGHPLQIIPAREIERHFDRITTMGVGGARGAREGGISFSNILFGFDSGEIKAASRPQLGEIARALAPLIRERGLRFRVVGHTDAKGSEEYNLALSERRARSVVRFLRERHGLPETHLRAVGLGESRPMAPNDTEEGRRQNRRVEVRIDE